MTALVFVDSNVLLYWRDASVVVHSRFTLGIREATAEYPASPPRYRHPARGRPRKVMPTEANG